MLGHDQHYFLHFNLPYIPAYCSFPITQDSEIISISTSNISSIIQFVCTIPATYISLYICLIKKFIAMNDFEFKKYFKNLVGLEPVSMKTTSKVLLTKGVSDKRLVKRQSK